MDVASRIGDFAMAVWKIFLPVALVFSFVNGPDLSAVAFFLAVFPLAFVNVTCVRTNPFFVNLIALLRYTTFRN